MINETEEQDWKTRYEQWLEGNEDNMRKLYYGATNDEDFNEFCKEQFSEETGEQYDEDDSNEESERGSKD